MGGYMHLRKIFLLQTIVRVAFIFRTTKQAYNEALAHSLPHSPFPSLLSLRFLPDASIRKNLSESSRRVSNSGYRSISTAPYLTASVNRFGLRPASPFITHETIFTDGDGGCCISWYK